MNSAPPPDACRDPFDDVLNALINGDASPRDHVVFNDTLRSDPEARRSYIRAMAFEAMLAREFAPAAAETPPVAVRPRRWVMPAAIAATILLAATLAWRWQPGPAAPPALADDADEEITHAVITSLDDASGNLDAAPLAQGLRLSSGTLELTSGIAEITFDTGAEITLEGPARLQVISENTARLLTGRASAVVPEPARGFVVLTPSSYIRDLGTAFAVEVREDRDTDLHVMEGEVEVSTADRKAANLPRILRQREAVRLGKGAMRPISFRADTPGSRRKKPPRNLPPAVHWSFDAWDANTTADATRGHLLRLQQKKLAAVPETLAGPFGHALHFDGEGTFASSDYPGVGGSQARTVAAWVRIQPAADRPQPNGIIAWGVQRSQGKWQVAWNHAPGQGSGGAPRVEFGDGFAIGSTDLRDGRWHHLAVVYLGGPKANVATHVRIYVDGQLETLTGRRNRRIDTDTTSANARPLTIGRYLGGSPDRAGRFFEGDLDEVYVFEGALLPSQILRLMKRNELAPTPP
ncbi:MAG: hypothetical protein RLZZ522_1535 [Verrucomicrobiota bacterium]